MHAKCEFRQRILRVSGGCVFLVGPWALIVGPTTWEKCKFNFKIKSHGTIHTFKIILLQ